MDLLRVDGQANVQAAAPPFVFQKLFGDTDAGEHAPALVGPEDLELDLTNPKAPSLLASCQKRPREDEQGFIARVLLGPEGPVSWRRLDLQAWPAGAAFHPLGISLCAPERKLYVVNKDREGGGHRVEVFGLDEDVLRYEETLLAPGVLTDPNDIVALPGGRLFVTNPHEHAGLGNLASDIFKATNGTVVARDDVGWSTVAEDISFANGVAVDGTSSVYVTSTRKGLLAVFAKTGEVWTENARLEIAGQPDNLTWADPRHLVVASHNSIAAFVLHAATGGGTRSPARVFRIGTQDRPLSIELLLEHDGSGISAISTAILFQDRLYLGQVIDKGIGVAVRVSS